MSLKVIGWHEVSKDLMRLDGEVWRGFVMQDATEDARAHLPKGARITSVEMIDRPSDAVLAKLGFDTSLEFEDYPMVFTVTKAEPPDAG